MLYFSRWKSALIWLIVLVGFILALPNLFPSQQLQALPAMAPKGQIVMGLDLSGGTRLVMQSASDKPEDIAGAIDIMSRRLNELGYDNPQITQQGKKQIIAEVPGLYDPQLIKDLLSLKGEIDFRVAREAVNSEMNGQTNIPADSEVIYSFDDPPVGYIVKKQSFLSTQNIVDVEVGVDINADVDEGDLEQNSVITLSLDEEGAKQLAQATGANIGALMAVIIDKQIITAPQIKEQVTNGLLQISGDYDLETISNLGVVLHSGALPTSITVIEERTVASALGQNYASYGLLTALAALLIVAAFMILSYGLLGLIAIIALAVNVMLVIAVASVLGIPIGLASIAGLVLTIGMAVDSNILIYEKIREDRRNGFSVVQAIESGFSRARSSIIDANLTTLIAAIMLFLFGSGALQGFAQIVTIGLLTTLFTTFTFSRLLISLWVKQSKPTTIPARLIKLIPTNTKIGFMKLSGITAAISISACAISIALYAIFGLNYGVDFRGGTSVELQAVEGVADFADIQARLIELNIDGARVFEGKSQDIAQIQIASQDVGDDAEQTVAFKLRDEFEADYEFLKLEVVGPTVSDQLTHAGIASIVLALLGVFAYLWTRFRWQYALGAVLATIHDVIIMIGIFALFRFEFNLWSVAAILSVIGYSLNDTVVVFDRIRDNFSRYSTTRVSVMIDASINQTLSRTILTSMVTILALIPLYGFGGEDIGSFALMMTLGIIIGTYSSIYIAGPLLWRSGLKPDKINIADKAS